MASNAKVYNITNVKTFIGFTARFDSIRVAIDSENTIVEIRPRLNFIRLSSFVIKPFCNKLACFSLTDTNGLI
jgi:hypothetical protein